MLYLYQCTARLKSLNSKDIALLFTACHVTHLIIEVEQIECKDTHLDFNVGDVCILGGLAERDANRTKIDTLLAYYLCPVTNACILLHTTCTLSPMLALLHTTCTLSPMAAHTCTLLGHYFCTLTCISLNTTTTLCMDTLHISCIIYYTDLSLPVTKHLKW